MCWSAEVSLITFITSASMCAYLWYRNEINDRTLSLWIFSFALMQLFEFFMWINMKNHSFVSKLSLIFIFLQPFVLSCALLKYGTIYDSKYAKYAKYLLWFLIALLTIKIIYTIYYAFVVEANKEWLSVKGPNCHLIWHFMKHYDELPYLCKPNSLYGIPLIIGCMLIKPFFPLGIIYSIGGIFTYFVSLYIYGLEFGSIWCWIANIMGIIAISSKYLI